MKIIIIFLELCLQKPSSITHMVVAQDLSSDGGGMCQVWSGDKDFHFALQKVPSVDRHRENNFVFSKLRDPSYTPEASVLHLWMRISLPEFVNRNLQGL